MWEYFPPPPPPRLLSTTMHVITVVEMFRTHELQEEYAYERGGDARLRFWIKGGGGGDRWRELLRLKWAGNTVTTKQLTTPAPPPKQESPGLGTVWCPSTNSSLQFQFSKSIKSSTFSHISYFCHRFNLSFLKTSPSQDAQNHSKLCTRASDSG